MSDPTFRKQSKIIVECISMLQKKDMIDENDDRYTVSHCFAIWKGKHEDDR